MKDDKITFIVKFINSLRYYYKTYLTSRISLICSDCDKWQDSCKSSSRSTLLILRTQMNWQPICIIFFQDLLFDYKIRTRKQK